MTDALFRENAYVKNCEARIVDVNDRGGIILDRTVFYATGGGQPGDCGKLVMADGTAVEIVTCVYDEDGTTIIHVPAEGQSLPQVGTAISAEIDWDNRYKLMRMHTALHLLSVILPYPVTGGQIGADTGRLDFDMGEASLDKEQVIQRLNELVEQDAGVSSEWITDEELDANPSLVKTMAVKPPRGSGRVRLVRIGENIDLQPCGGTHVAHTSEIGRLELGKVEKKGKQNRRVRIRFAAA